MIENINSQSSPLEQKEISVKELIEKLNEWLLYLLNKWKVIILSGIICGIIGVIYASFQKYTYSATLTFALEDDKNGPSIGGALGLASSFGFDLGGSAGGAFSGSNLIELMKSRRLVEQALLNKVVVNEKETTLAELYIQYNGWRDKWKSSAGLNEQLQFRTNGNRNKFTLQQDSILGTIYNSLIENNLSVSQKDKKVSILSIDVKSENEIFAKTFSEVLAKEVSDFYIDTKSKKARLNLQILEKQADSIRSELNGAITGVAVENDNVYNLNPAFNVKRTSSTKRQVDVQANSAILIELVKNLELARVTLRKETPLIQIIDLPILPLKKDKIGKRNSLIVGGFIGGLVCLLVLIFKRWWRRLMDSK